MTDNTGNTKPAGGAGVDNIAILAGGAGTRLWPASNSKRPKQFIPVRGGKSLLLLTVERALRLGRGDIFIVTLDEQIDQLAAECDRLEEGRERVKLVAEPAPRNTAPAIAAAAAILRNSGREKETLAVLPADHLISPVEAFAADMAAAAALARAGHLVTFGVKPTRAETGYGYIETGEALEGGLAVQSFREKPDAETAERFYREGGYFWNSGMFCFRVDRYFEELRSGRPDIAEVFEGITVSKPSETMLGMELFFRDDSVRKAYQASPKDSVDYAVMEKCKSVAMVEATFEWNDIGSWDELSTVIDGSSAVEIESSGCFVDSDIPVALCGVNDLMVVQKNGVLLICRKGSGQLVKQAVNRFKEEGRDELL